MLMRSETIGLRVCGNCEYVEGGPYFEEIEKLERAYLKYVRNEHSCLILLRRQASHLKNVKVLCRKENTEMGVFDEVCALWKKK